MTGTAKCLNLPSLALFGFLGLAACSKSGGVQAAPLYDSIPVKSKVEPVIKEGSGIADSRRNPGFLWVAEDSGNPPRLFLVGHDGQVKHSVYLNGAVNIDWEEIQLAGDTLVVADIGDNNQVRTVHTLYLLPEPGPADDTVTVADSIRFEYPDHPHDAEAFVVDPVTGDIFIITKRDDPSEIYRIPFPYSRNAVITAEKAGHLAYGGVTGAAISGDGSRILVKLYPALRQYERRAGESLNSALAKAFINVPYVIEPQGEAVTFALDQSGYFTISEKAFAPAVYLYFYRAL